MTKDVYQEYKESKFTGKRYQNIQGELNRPVNQLEGQSKESITGANDKINKIVNQCNHHKQSMQEAKGKITAIGSMVGNN